MLNKLKKIIQASPLLKVTSFNSLSVVVKMITGLGIAKLSAYFLGPQGIALLGNYRNFLNIAHNFSTAGLEKAAVKYASESENNTEKQRSYISSLIGIGLVVSLIIGILIYSFSGSLNSILFFKNDFSFVIQLLAFVLPLHMFNVYLIAMLKAYEKFKKIISIQIVGHFLNALVFGVLIYVYSLQGALIALTLIPSALVVFSLYFFRAHWSIFKLFSWKSLNKKLIENFSQYALMTLISSISFPLVFLGIRNTIIADLSETDAGLWEATNQIARYYLMFVLSLLNLFILPKLIKAKSNAGFKAVVVDFYKKIIPLYILGLAVVYAVRKPLLGLVFTEEFLAAEQLFAYQILGDFFRIASLVMVYQFHAKKMMKAFIITDLGLALSLYFSSVYFIQQIGLQGAVFGHFIAYLSYFVVILFYFRKVFIYPLFIKK